jgi:hypothetical protein
VSVYVVRVKFGGEPVQDVLECPTRSKAARAAAGFLVASRADGNRPVSVGILVVGDSDRDAPRMRQPK